MVLRPPFLVKLEIGMLVFRKGENQRIRRKPFQGKQLNTHMGLVATLKTIFGHSHSLNITCLTCYRTYCSPIYTQKTSNSKYIYNEIRPRVNPNIQVKTDLILKSSFDQRFIRLDCSDPLTLAAQTSPVAKRILLLITTIKPDQSIL